MQQSGIMAVKGLYPTQPLYDILNSNQEEV